MKKRLSIMLVAMLVMLGAFAAPAFAKYDYSCYPWGGFTYHKHWNVVETWYHGTDHYSYYNEFWYWDNYEDGWIYYDWDYCY